MAQKSNPVKETSKALDMTYKELAEAIGVSEGTIKQNALRDEVSDQLRKALELLIENSKLRKEAEKTTQLKATLRELLK